MEKNIGEIIKPANTTVAKSADESEAVGNILILKASKNLCDHELGSLEEFCKMIKLVVYVEEIYNEESIEYMADKYAKAGVKFDFVYLCAHGRKEGFETDFDGEAQIIPWSAFGGAICENSILTEETIFLLACCHGGILQVAIDLMAVCNNIFYVCGVRWTVQNWDLTTGFVVFMHHIINKHAEPSYAAEKASLATDYKFACNNRDEVEGLQQYISRQEDLYYQLGWIDENGNTITTDEMVLANTDLPRPQSETDKEELEEITKEQANSTAVGE